MAKCGKKCINAKKTINRDNFPLQTGTIMHLEKEHKKWYRKGAMGKQRGKPHYAPPKLKKTSK